MEVIGTRAGIRKACDRARSGDRTVGFVPTMGYLHEGHRSLIATARRERDTLVVSIFVNPLQFGPGEDLAKYPRDKDRDLAMCEREDVDLVFAPEVSEMYADGDPETTVDPGSIADVLEGASRPGHFRGVATVVARLFNLVGPCRAYFGEKDAQQLAVVRAVVRDLQFPVAVMGCPTIREPDGLALSSRNVYLSDQERRAALCLSRALREAVALVARGERDAAVIRAAMDAVVGAEPLASLDYATVVDEGTFEEVDRVERAARAVIAAKVGPARLIDNMALGPGLGGSGG